MARINRTEMLLLGLLADSPRSGYDIKKEVQERLSHFWSESYGQIYPALRRLLEQDLVVRREEAGDAGPRRFIYSITEDGQRTLRDWFATESDPVKPRNELLLRLYFGRFADPADLLADIESFRERSSQAHQFLASTLEAHGQRHAEDPDFLFTRLTMRYGIEVMNTLRRWSKEAEAALRERVKSSTQEPRESLPQKSPTQEDLS